MRKILFIAFLFLCLDYGLVQAQELITYPAPEAVIHSMHNNDYTVQGRKPGGAWKDLFEYNVKVNMRDPQNASIVYFDFSGEVEVSVRNNKENIRNVKIRPLSDSIVPAIQGNTVKFTLKKPQNISIEFNGDRYHNLHLFANPVEESRPDPADEKVMYFGPGWHVPSDSTGMYQIKSNETVYIAGGAVVRGGFVCDSVENVTITGRGVIYHPAEGIVAKYSRNIEIGGLIFIDPDHYTVTSGESKNVKIHNIKSFSYKGWGDGIDVFCSSNVRIDHVFMRNSDDCIAIYGHRWNYYGNTQNIQVTHSTLWADVAHPVNIGTHGDSRQPDTLSNMVFSDINILQQNEPQIDYQGCMAINAGDENLVKDILFENIHIDHIRTGQIVNLRVMFNKKYNTAPGRGIENIYFKNIDYKGSPPNLSIITGYNGTRAIKHITFENLKINGQVIYDNMPGKPGYYKTSDMARFFTGAHVEGVKFISTRSASGK